MIKRILNLSWKNIWRNPSRSSVVIVAVLLGTWAGIFIAAFFNGMAQGYLQNQLNLSVGHLQITHPEFKDQFNPVFSIPDASGLVDSLKDKPYVREILPQSLTTGLAQSTQNSFGVTIHGVKPDPGAPVPVLQYLEQGSFLDEDVRNPIVIGTPLAERLDLEPGSKMVLSFQDTEGSITAGAFRVTGIFDSFNKNYDKGNVFVRMSDLNNLLGQEGLIHKITIKVDDFTQATAYRDALKNEFPELNIAGWGEIAPELRYVFETMDISMYVIMIIIIVALVFSIINTMLMAIIERTKELGMLMAVGMNQSRIFFMILAETFFLTMTGTPVGLLLSWTTVAVLSQSGINLGAFAEGLSAYGMSTVIYPELEAGYYINITLMIALAAVLSALYPAWKTLQLRPVEAIRKI